jgi:hypothetical protein
VFATEYLDSFLGFLHGCGTIQVDGAKVVRIGLQVCVGVPKTRDDVSGDGAVLCVALGRREDLDEFSIPDGEAPGIGVILVVCPDRLVAI